MISSQKQARTPARRSTRLAVLGLCVLVLAGCQKLFHDQDAVLKGQKVTVSMSVPDTPPPAAPPLKSADSPSPAPAPPQRPLDRRLLPSPQLPPPEPLLVQGARVPVALSSRSAALAADTVLPGKVVTEDLVLRGTVLIKGSLVVAPHATLRIEAGATVRFAGEQGAVQPSSLVIQGRLVVNGTAQRPVLLGPAFLQAEAGDWGGVVLLGSEKKNSLDYCRIEGAQTALLAQHSRFAARGLEITRARRGIELYESEAMLQGGTVSRCDIGCRLVDSEFDLRDTVLRENRQGLFARRSSSMLTNATVAGNAQEGAVIEQGRFRITGSRFAENRIGALFFESDGQLDLSRFSRNREHGLELQGGRVRIRNAAITGNGGSGLVIDTALGMITGSEIRDNGGSNLQNRGQEPFPALLNWWGSTDQRAVAGTIHAVPRQDGMPTVPFVPFLTDRPAGLP